MPKQPVVISSVSVTDYHSAINQKKIRNEQIQAQQHGKRSRELDCWSRATCRQFKGSLHVYIAHELRAGEHCSTGRVVDLASVKGFIDFQKKINVNTDVRLAAANENFLKHHMLVGVTDDIQDYKNTLQLWFVHFDPEGCLRSLSQRLDEMKRGRMAALRQCLDQLCIVMETVLVPGEDGSRRDLGSVDATKLSEELPLFSNGQSTHKKPLQCSEIFPLIQDGTPEAMAHQLLVIFSACYVRLLITSQLPDVPATRHAQKVNVPCLCQFIEASALENGPFWTKKG